MYKLLPSLLFSDPKFNCKRAKEEQNDFSPLILSPITGVIEETNQPELWHQNYVTAQRCFVIDKKKHTRCSATSIYKQYLKVIIQKQIFRENRDGFHFFASPETFDMDESYDDAIVASLLCRAGFIPFYYVTPSFTGCNIGKIMARLCLVENDIHTTYPKIPFVSIGPIKIPVWPRNDNRALKRLMGERFIKGKSSEHAKMANKECSKLIMLEMGSVTEENFKSLCERGSIYLQSSLDAGFTRMFIERNSGAFYPQSGFSCTDQIQKAYDENTGSIQEKYVTSAIPIIGHNVYWYVCYPISSSVNCET